MQSNIIQHIVKERDTLQALSKRYLNDSSMWLRLALFNNLDYPYIVEDSTILRSSGYITLYRDISSTSNISIATGTLFRADSEAGAKFYESINEGTLTFEGSSTHIEVPVQSTVPGMGGDLEAKSSISLITNIVGISGCTNFEPITLHGTYARASGVITISFNTSVNLTISAGTNFYTEYDSDVGTILRGYYSIGDVVVSGTSALVTVRAVEAGAAHNTNPYKVNFIGSPYPSMSIIDISDDTITLSSDRHGITSGNYIRVRGTDYNDGVYLVSSILDNAITIASEDPLTDEQAVGVVERVPSYFQYINSVVNLDSLVGGKILNIKSVGDILYIPYVGPNTTTSSKASEKDLYSELLKSDLYLSADGDLLVNPSGDLQTVEGIDNIAQAINNRLSTPVGSVFYHPTYGSLLTSFLGSLGNTSNLMIIKKEAMRVLRADPRIAEVVSVQVEKSGVVVNIMITVKLIGSSSNESFIVSTRG